ncbi:hypothetical protein RND81_10G219000 [Saponaria officinalis]|uniref:S-protein homolog n=1 Tax=Saponaria officinalis TaxID=3572 RepID=A0AAW1I5W2_SAPOF
MLKFWVAILVIVSLTCQKYTIGFTPFPARYWLVMENGLEHDTIDLQCKRYVNDDEKEVLGLQHIPPSGNFSFNFKTTFFKTIYKCNVTWPNHGRLTDMTGFEDDQPFEDYDCGGRHCTWKFASDAIYLFNLRKQRFIQVGTWDKWSV